MTADNFTPEEKLVAQEIRKAATELVAAMRRAHILGLDVKIADSFVMSAIYGYCKNAVDTHEIAYTTPPERVAERKVLISKTYRMP